MKTLAIMTPFFLLAIGGTALIWTNEQPWLSLGWAIISLLFASMFGAMVVFQTPSQERINRREWGSLSIAGKLKWKLKHGLRRN